jgi:DNA-binding IclR family transcriptional regulator
MTKVEELTEDMVFLVQGCDREFFEKYATKLNDLISASHAEGVEEGTEETLAKIREVARPLLVGLGGVLAVVSIPASVLAPKGLL